MREWDVLITLDTPLPDEEMLGRFVEELPGGPAVGRAITTNLLTVGVSLYAATPVAAGELGTALARHTSHLAGLGDVEVVGLEVCTPEETDRRGQEPAALDLVSVTEAADMLGITPAAVRARAQRGEMEAVKVGEAGWVMPRRAVELAARVKAGHVRATVSDDESMKGKMGGPLGQDQQGVPLTGDELADYWAKEEARLGRAPKTRPTAAEQRRIDADIKAAKEDEA